MWTLPTLVASAYLSPYLPCTPYLLPCPSDSSNKKTTCIAVAHYILSWSVTLHTYSRGNLKHPPRLALPCSSHHPFSAKSLLLYNVLLKFYLTDAFPNPLRQLEISCDFFKVHVQSYNSFPLLKLFFCFVFPKKLLVPRQSKEKHLIYLCFHSLFNLEPSTSRYFSRNLGLMETDSTA